jgi:hypothetical protein
MSLEKVSAMPEENVLVCTELVDVELVLLLESEVTVTFAVVKIKVWGWTFASG